MDNQTHSPSNTAALEMLLQQQEEMQKIAQTTAKLLHSVLRISNDNMQLMQQHLNDIQRLVQQIERDSLGKS